MIFWSMIGVNKITNLGIDFRLNYRFWDLYYGKNAKVGKKLLSVA